MKRILSWASALTLASLLLAVCLQALLGPEPNALFGLMALKTGVPEMATTGRYIVCGVKLLAVGLLLFPRVRQLGAILGLAVSLGAVIAHMTPWLGVDLPHLDALSAALSTGASLEEIARLPTDRGGLFLLALASVVLATATLMIERAPVRGRARARPSADAYA
jgi:hypothetical protein